MARQRIAPAVGVKMFESYTDFSGGLNTETSNERLGNNELTTLDNVDLSARGSIKRRTGRNILQSFTGTPQGIAYYYRKNNEAPDTVVFANGKINVILNTNTNEKFEVPIQNGDSTYTFPTTKDVEAVQYRDTLYIATGDNLCALTYTSLWQANTPYYVGDLAVIYSRTYRCTKSGVSGATQDFGSGHLAWKKGATYAAGNTVYSNGYVYTASQVAPGVPMVTSNDSPPSHKSGVTTDGGVYWTYTTRAVTSVPYWEYIADCVTPGHAEWSAKVVTAYKPTQMEYVYIGTNALATNPSNYVSIEDVTSGLDLDVLGVTTSHASGYAGVNTEVTFTAYVVATSTSPLNELRYKWEYKKSSDTSTTWLPSSAAFSATASGKSFTLKFSTADEYDIRVTMKHSSGSTEYTYILTKFKVGYTNAPLPRSNTIRYCNRIMLHWDRIILYGDPQNPYQVYISDLENPEFFPSTNTVLFDSGKSETINSIVRYRDYLVIFTKTTIYSMTGKSPEDYSRALIHDGIGCIHGRSAKVAGNVIIFVSDEGIFQLRPNQYVQERLNVSRIDNSIKTEVANIIKSGNDDKACALVHDSQYSLCFPEQKVMYRFYFEQGIWVRDVSDKLQFVDMISYGEDVLELSLDNYIWKQNKTTYADGTFVYDMVAKSKYLDLSMSFNYKKLKRLYILAKHFVDDVDLYVKVEADTAIVLNPEDSYATTESGEAVWKVNLIPNFKFYSGTVVGTWALGTDPLGEVTLSIQKASVTGKCRRARITMTHSQNTPCEVYGFGLEFKEKKV